MRQDKQKRSLATVRPDLLEEWDVEKNGDLTPHDLLPQSSQKVWWKCGKGHEWEARVFNRTRGTGCPHCDMQRRRKADKNHNLHILFPRFAAEWHPEKNGDLTPSDVKPKSHTKVWWKCREGHEWLATVASRTNMGSGCPFCSGRMATQDNNLAMTNPELAAQWHSARNGDLTPYNLLPQSGQKVWWKCAKGHEWVATVASRDKGDGCPYCSGHRVSKDNNLAVRFPHLVVEWDVEKNGILTPHDITPGSSRKVWWKCRRGHKSYLASPAKRTGIDKTGCPECNPQTSRQEFRLFCELTFLFPDAKWRTKTCDIECDIYLPSHKVAIEYDGVHWHRSKVGRDIKKGEDLKELGITLFRLREYGLNAISPLDIVTEDRNLSLDSIKRLLTMLRNHISVSPEEQSKFEIYLNSPDFIKSAKFDETAYTLSMPQFEDSVAAHPVLSQEWDHDRNGSCKPEMFPLGSGERVWWKCSKGHVWRARIYSRSNGKGCPECAGKVANKDNNLATLVPYLAAEWHPTKNGDLTPYDVLPYSNKKVWWRCVGGHVWQAKVNNRTRSNKNGCPYCAGQRVCEDNNLGVRYPELTSEWDAEENGDLTPYDVMPGSHRRIWWKCSRGHRWQARANIRIKGHGCPYCAGQRADAQNNLAVRYPALASEWDTEKNVDLTPYDVMPGSDRRVWWKCKQGHEWQSSVYNRTKNGGVGRCPICSRENKTS
jgi:hypothetical protein